MTEEVLKICKRCREQSSNCAFLNDNMYCDKLEAINARIEILTKAKSLLEKLVELSKPKGGGVPPAPIQIATEQFLKELEEGVNE